MVIITKIEIAAAPDVVRKVLLDFSQYNEWHKSGLIKSITPVDKDAQNEDAVAVGKKLFCVFSDFEFECVVVQNTPTSFAWQGPPVMSVSGLHSFLFEPSNSTPGGSTFTQMESYSGPIAFLMQSWLLGAKIKKGFEGFNEDLKGTGERGLYGGGIVKNEEERRGRKLIDTKLEKGKSKERGERTNID
ncbi:hypothetical protein ACMFMG_004715 [Clarireedia jacksonii]